MEDVKAEQLKWIEEKKAEDERLEYNGGTFEDVAWYISLSMPLVIGMSAAIERFNKLIDDVDSSTHRTIISVDDVRGSGLLKDKIVITYPEDIQNKDMAILQAATDEWKSIEPSRIDDDRNIKVVFFKESLTTRWDSPRSE